MKTSTILLAGSLLALAACGGGGGNDRAKIYEACVSEDGNSPEMCNCMADAAVEQLDSDLLGKLADAAGGGEDAVQNIVGDLSAEETQQFMRFAMTAGTQCEAMGQ